MLTAARKNMSLIGTYFKLNLSASMEYRTSFLLQTFGMFLNNASFAFFWWLLFDQVGDIAGYDYLDVMLLWALASTSYGLALVFFGNLNRLSDIIIKGELDTYLLQPKDVVINVLASKTVISAWGDILYGVILFIIITDLSLKAVGLFILFCITGALIFSGVLLVAHCLTFFFGNAKGVVTAIFEFLITFSIYPEGIYKGFVKMIIYTVIPSGFITLMPLEVMKAFELKNFLLVIGVAIIWVTFAYSIFYQGLKKYESGNLMVQKM